MKLQIATFSINLHIHVIYRGRKGLSMNMSFQKGFLSKIVIVNFPNVPFNPKRFNLELEQLKVNDSMYLSERCDHMRDEIQVLSDFLSLLNKVKYWESLGPTST